MIADKIFFKIASIVVICALLFILSMQFFEHAPPSRRIIMPQEQANDASAQQAGTSLAATRGTKPIGARMQTSLPKFPLVTQHERQKFSHHIRTLVKLHTPSATVQSMIQALSNADIANLPSICLLDGEAQAAIDALFRALSVRQREHFGNPEYFLFAAMSDNRITHYAMRRRARINGESASMEIHITREGGTQMTERFQFLHVYENNQWQWKIVLGKNDVDTAVAAFLNQ